MPDAGDEVLYTNWEAASVQRALTAEQTRLDVLRDAVEQTECEVGRLRRRLAWLERRQREAATD